MVKLELGSGQRPSPGYIHTDAHDFPGLDHIGSADTLECDDESLEEVLALGVIEHLTYQQAVDTFRNVYRWLAPGGVFLFDVPDLPVWCEYLSAHARGESAPFDLQHVLCTLFGWQRWEGDEHKSGWTKQMLEAELVKFSIVWGVDSFVERGHYRRRFARPQDAHLYVTATK